MVEGWVGRGWSRSALPQVVGRLIVDLDTRCPWRWARCQAMVSGPASRPASTSSLRSRTINSTRPGARAAGEVWGDVSGARVRSRPRLQRALSL